MENSRSIPSPGAQRVVQAGLALILQFAVTLKSPASESAPAHWAFQAVTRPSPPLAELRGASANNPVDQFIAARLQQAGLAMSREADRRTLFRRLSLDLTGLPPTPEEMGAFESDPRPDAYERQVDALLASPQFGERWTRHWLDVVRYAETHGFEMNQPRPQAWPYRDYLIHSFNEDKPFNQLVSEQLAGDALGVDEATGFLVAGPMDQVKSPDEVLTRNQRADELHDIINTTGTTFLGLTLGCARCHDHKFDPIPQQDYYAIKAIFEGVQHGERPLRPPDDSARERALDAARIELEPIENRLSQFEPLAVPARTLLLDDDTPSGSDITAPSVTQVVGRTSLDNYPPGSRRGELEDPGNAIQLPNLGRNFSTWNAPPDADLFTWNPRRAGRYHVWLSWPTLGKTSATNAVYLLDRDGNLDTKSDQQIVARVDQSRFGDDTLPGAGSTLWSGFKHAGVFEFTPESRLVLRSGEIPTTAGADVVLFQESVAAIAVADSPSLRSPVSAHRNRDRFPPVEARFLRFAIESSSDAEPCLDEIEVFSSGPAPTNIVATGTGTRVTASGTYPGNESHRLEHINDGLYGNEHSWISNEKGRGWVQFEFPGPRTIDQVAWSRDHSTNPVFSDRLATQYRIEVSDDGKEWQTVASSSDRLPRNHPSKVALIKTVAGLDPKGASELTSLLQRRQELDARIRQFQVVKKVYAGEFKAPELTRRFYRGDPMQPREVVSPATLSCIGPSTGLPAISTNTVERERRLAFAQWVIDPANPLTARVIVNRIWQYHFGEGLVSTPSDFGRNGARPSHPELLDWMASELMKSSCDQGAWRLKRIHRLIVTSAAYRQASDARASAMEVDAGSRLLWRYPPHRLEAEALRDTMLAVAGKLDSRMGGPGWSPFQPNDNYVRLYRAKERFGSEDFRRMVYASVVRQRVDGVFGAFDCPDGGQIAPKRTRSTTPLQALNLLNSGFMQQVAGWFAERLLLERGDPSSQVRRAFSLAFQRDPEAAELEAAVRLANEHGMAVLCRALLNANEFAYVF